jgi:pimeloyl-ACP methyl ester carboxylesterase
MSTTGRPISRVRRKLCRPSWVVAMCVPLLVASCLGCVSSNYLSVRRVPRNPLADPLNLFSRSGPKPTARTEQVLRRYDLERVQEREPDAVLARLQEELLKEPTADKMYAFSELAYVQAKKADSQGSPSRALRLYGASVAHAYLYLFASYLQERNCYDPQFRRACDLYNAGLEGMLRIVNKRDRLRPGEQFAIEIDGRQFEVAVMLKGLWHADDFKRFEFVSDYEVKGLVNRHVTYGLGVPLIAVRDKHEGQEPACQFYPERLSFPVTAILRAVEQPSLRPGRASVVSCALELHDPLLSDHVQIANRLVPLETDLTTPLGFFLDHREFKGTKLATWGLLDPNSANRWRGICMLEAFDPEKIPVLMVHGLWSSPDTWTEMLNELRSLPEVRNRYQFWTYLYPTGQPFWISATELREDLQRVRDTVDPQRRYAALDQMVLVGHSMGGLVSRMQTLESNEDFWRLLSDRPFSELKTDPETRARLEQLLFFDPNPAVRRVITIGTPHGGSRFSNDTTQWLGRKLIKLPAMLAQTRMRVIRDNPGFFRNTELLTVNTSIDSLSPESPVLPVLLRAEEAAGVRYNNIVGLIDESSWLRKIAKPGDGVVPFESAHLNDAESEIVVEADHVSLHQHPLTILEVRRILLQHSREMYAERGSQPSASPVAYVPPPAVPGGPGAPPGEPACSATVPTRDEGSPVHREAARPAGPQPSPGVR